ncbi:MAG TPA: UDP-N-acetylmuramoyl-L-alanyl-D-glutamate--2,6-diaminopimelate ligase [Thermomicrobiaceae bacterium]|nr:UDP-N-acetylmuramoyl-L-alanyl-D-glutamate--2,6-diaminopimelate ligase [Thermomicrobiaceae bacterium]
MGRLVNDDGITLDELVARIQPLRVRGDTSLPIDSVCYDSRQAVPRSLFVALRGGYADGHHFLEAARRAGAVAALVESWPPELDDYPAAVQVEDTRAALAQVAAACYRDPGASMGMVGVTGTDGKTTTTYLIDAMLRDAGQRTGLIGTVAVRIGERLTEHDLRQTTPESLDVQRFLSQMRAAGVDWAVLEATSHGLELHRLDSCPFDVGVVTNITHEHLELHGTVENYRRAKARLLEHVRAGISRPYPHGIVLNADDEGARSIAGYAGDVPITWFSTRDAFAAVHASEIEIEATGTRFVLSLPDGSRKPVNLRLIGGFNVENALAAAAVGSIMGLPAERIVASLEAFRSVPGRLVPVEQGQPYRVYVDYAHTPDSLEKILRLIRSLVPGRVIVVSGSAGERDRTKRPLQGAVCVRLADFAVFTSEDPRFENPDQIIAEIAAGAAERGAAEGRDYLCVEDRRAAIGAALDAAQPGDAVVLAGKGHESCIIYGAERRPWDEVAEASRALAERGFPARHED